jgi:hypothetical protein
MGPGCVKTRASRECAELFSPLSPFDRDCQCCSFPIQPNRDKISTCKFDVGVFTQPGSSLADVLHVSTSRRLRSRKRDMQPTERVDRAQPVGSSLVALARPREIRTPADLRCKLSLSPFTVRNHTKKTKYEGLENNSVSERKYCKSAVSSIAATLEKPRFVGRFSAHSLAEKSKEPVSLAEGEELGSNLLQVLHRRPTEFGRTG